MTIANNLKKARESAGFTLAMAARMSNIPASTIAAWEQTGSIPLCRAYVLSHIYNCKITEFLEGVKLND